MSTPVTPNETKVWVEEKEYSVTLTVEVFTTVAFGAMERHSPITGEDAIQNAIGLFDWTLFEQEGFQVVDPIQGRADRLDAWESQNYRG